MRADDEACDVDEEGGDQDSMTSEDEDGFGVRVGEVRVYGRHVVVCSGVGRRVFRDLEDVEKNVPFPKLDYVV